MLRTVALYTITLLISLSILGPSLSISFENEMDVEISQDFEEEKSENTKDLEEADKILQLSLQKPVAIKKIIKQSSFYHCAYTITHIGEIHSPPPDFKYTT